MIVLKNVSAEYKRNDYTKPRRRILDEVNAYFGPQKHVAVLGGAGCGKTTLLRLLCGTMNPSGGRIIRKSSVSFPVGFGGASSKMTVAQYLHFVSKCYNMDHRSFRDFVVNFAELEQEILERQFGKVQSDPRARLNMAVGYGLPFDIYLFDNRVATSDVAFRTRCLDVLNIRKQMSGIVLATREARLARQFCTSGLVLHNSKSFYFDDVETAISYYQTVSSSAPSPDDIYFKP